MNKTKRHPIKDTLVLLISFLAVIASAACTAFVFFFVIQIISGRNFGPLANFPAVPGIIICAVLIFAAIGYMRQFNAKKRYYAQKKARKYREG